jgi:hypothetical protein
MDGERRSGLHRIGRMERDGPDLRYEIHHAIGHDDLHTDL